MKLDILAIAAHPDDVELCCSGTVLKHIEAGYKVGIIDLTQGELGTRGSAKLRLEEAKVAAEMMGVSVRDNLGFADGFFVNDKTHQLALIQKIRQYQPEIVLANAVHDRHIDHGRASKLISDACFLSGLAKIETILDGQRQDRWRPKSVYHMIQDYYTKPDITIDITKYQARKFELILAYKSQFFNTEYDKEELQTPISSKDFLDFLAARAREIGRPAGYTFAEGFTVERTIGVKNLFDLD
jgi:N-acetylglucosamine malate deacetylase 1